MLATLVDEPFDSDDWLFEIKWDGYRALTYLSGDEVQMISRNNKPFEEKYFPIAEALKALQLEAVLDGEIVAIDDKGLANFQRLQNWQNTPTKLQFYVFDILWLDGYDVTRLPLLERKKLLEHILPKDHEVIKYSDHVIGGGNDFFKAALEQGLEGIMAKKASSIYQVDSRAETWLKIKVNLRQEVIITGFTAPRKTRKFFGALMLGVYKDNKLMYVGHSGSGFDQKKLKAIYDKMQPLVQKECPFAKCPKGNMPVTWIKPELVCEIKFTEWTKEGIARHPIFMGLREDKKVQDVHMENSTNTNVMVEKTPSKKGTSAPAKEASTDKKAPAKKTAAKKTAAKKSASKSGLTKAAEPEHANQQVRLDLSNGKDQDLSLDGHVLKLTNLDKLYWKKEKRSKLDSVNYYLEVAPYMLPYMIDRPQSLNRHPNGIDAPNFFQKDMKGKQADWMKTHIDFSESTNQEVEYLVCSNEATLIYMANLGCIEMHPWHSRSDTWQQPDWCLIDLDPDTTNTFQQVIDIAQVVKKILDSLNADSFVKTSGSSGIHIYIPLGAKYNYDQSKQLAELIVNLVHQELPDITSVERNPAKRKGKIYLDFLQNRETQTAAAPYSLRPKPGMPVSTPLHWDEVKKGLTPTTYNMDNIFDRLKAEGDLFKGVLGKGINLEQVLKKLEALVS
jgi:bifunctional non-homologous end joining protein LigD